ncbi:methyl-accepting chemotaxis protein [Curvibacter sp. APW13]|uniref:methyl-accepting chemotaxis protein n=1 Tax=Curvibacter sp. APW13 TaxID=3077236 RepID=UPI0028DD8C23|nr:methyl-accepting chemotaxis protein [Curvibacter sp. APW13]MDT8990812.1 methyl-accepting chemotaxis protein [Curvibacter sp. APW13]
MEIEHSSAALAVAGGQPQAAWTPEEAQAPKTSGMQQREALSVKGSLALAFACLLVGVLIMGGFSLVQMGRLNASTQAIYEKEYAAGQAAEQLRSNLLRISRAQKQLLTASTADERVALGKDVDQSVDAIHASMKTIESLSQAEQAQETAKALATPLDKWTKRVRAFVDMVKAQPLELLEMSWEVPLEDAGLLNDTKKLEKLVDALVAQRSESAQATIAQAQDIYTGALVWVGGLTVVLIGVSVVVGGWVTRRLIRQLGGEPGYAKEIASRIAHGELSLRIDLDPKDTESLLHSLHEMQQQLAQTMRDIANSSSQVANASREISMGNLDLSRRTEQQAQSLEDTNKSIQYMAGITTLYADSAAKAASLSGAADRAAQHGGDVVSGVVHTMEQINESTQAIHANISVIQSIAFQTNILALNAAVEAAHAGEQGRGFAVVAAEVRDLAQRSSTAAREISAAIEQSADRVREGKRLVDEAGRAISELAQTVRQVSTVMEELSGASAEQAQGIAKINQAISQLDEVTQQNASLVQHAAASAHSLDEQAQSLDQLVGRFELARP